MYSLNSLVLRNLRQQRSRTILSALAVALGVSMIVAADFIGGAMVDAMTQSEDLELAFGELARQMSVYLTLIGFAVALAAGFVTYNAFAMAVTRRRQQIGSLRSLGMTRRQVLRLVLVEALVTGMAGTLIGLIAGPLAGQGVVALMQSSGSGFNAFGQSSTLPASVALAIALGVGVPLLSALLPARQATRMSPLVALRPPQAGGIERGSLRWALVGVLIVAIMAAYLAVAPPADQTLPPWDRALTGLFALLWLAALALILPPLIGGVGRWARRVSSGCPLGRVWGATGRLAADNLQRDRRRVTLTVGSLAIGLALIVVLTGGMTFLVNELISPMVQRAEVEQMPWVVLGFVMRGEAEDLESVAARESLLLSPGDVAAVEAVASNRADVGVAYFAVVPELSLFGSGWYSIFVEPEHVQHPAIFSFAFTEGDWEAALPLLESGCGVLVTPAVASRNGVGLHDTFEVTGVEGLVECVVAGIGKPTTGVPVPVAGAVSASAREAFGAGAPVGILIVPRPGVDREELEADLRAATDRQHAFLMVESDAEAAADTGDSMGGILAMGNGMLLMATVAAALGVVNTTVMSITERRRELGLLRAVGATRWQIVWAVVGETALMGLVGGGMGLVAGAGVVVLIATVHGANGWGFVDFDPWGAAWRSVQPALLNGLFGLLAAPVISAGAAWFPARSILRGSAIETLQPERTR